jgi:ABC-type branched-subunit amino acid transport system ATPase component
MRTSSAEADAGTGTSAEILQLRNITAGYGRVPIIHGVSVSARKGEITAIIGPNGAGKSTLLKASMGILHCSDGSIVLDGEELQNPRVHELARRGMGYVPQVRDVFDPLSVMENLEMGGFLLQKGEVSARVQEVFTLFPPLASRRKQRASTLSGGERKMLAIGRVYMTRPKALLLDEPTASLAPKIADSLLAEHVAKLAALGVAIVLVEQRAVQALAIASNAYIMVGGQVAASGTPAELGDRGEVARIFLRG